MNDLLVNNGYNRLTGELGLYSNCKVYIGLYVDDLLIAGNLIEDINKAKSLLKLKF